MKAAWLALAILLFGCNRQNNVPGLVVYTGQRAANLASSSNAEAYRGESRAIYSAADSSSCQADSVQPIR